MFFPAVFKNPDYMMEKTGRYDAGSPLPASPELAGQAHKAKPLPSPPEPSFHGGGRCTPLDTPSAFVKVFRLCPSEGEGYSSYCHF